MRVDDRLTVLRYTPSPLWKVPFSDPEVLPPMVVIVDEVTAATCSTCVPPPGP
jgi:hypothetical protein